MEAQKVCREGAFGALRDTSLGGLNSTTRKADGWSSWGAARLAQSQPGLTDEFCWEVHFAQRKRVESQLKNEAWAWNQEQLEQ